MSFCFCYTANMGKVGELGKGFNKTLTFGTVLLGLPEVGVVNEVLKKGWKLC